MPLEAHPKISLHAPYFMCSRFELNDKSLFLCFDWVFVLCVVDLGVNEEEPVNEPYCEQENEDQFRDPEPEGQDIPEGFEDGKFNPILWCMFLS